MQFFNEVTPKQVLGILLDASKVERDMKKVEEREQFFGRIFGILAIFRSTRLLKEESEGSKEVAKKCTEEVFALYKSKRWLREICVQTFLTMLRNAHVTIISTILEGTLPMFEETVVGENGEELLTPVPLTSSSLCYLLEVKTLLQQRELHLPEELQGIYESNPDIEPSHLVVADGSLPRVDVHVPEGAPALAGDDRLSPLAAVCEQSADGVVADGDGACNEHDGAPQVGFFAVAESQHVFEGVSSAVRADAVVAVGRAAERACDGGDQVE